MNRILDQSRLSNAWRVLAASGFLLAAGVPAANSQTSPLPGVTITQVKPVIWFVLDVSGSMEDCDGGLFDESDAAALARYDPRTSTADDGECLDSDDETSGNQSHDSYGTSTWDHDASGATAPVNERGSSSQPRIYMMTRGEALKVAMGRLLDANNNGTIDASDESSLGFYAGMSYYDTDSGGTYKTNASVVPVGTAHSTLWTAIQALTFSGGTPHGPALAGARALGVSKCYDDDGTTSYAGVAGGCALPTAEVTADTAKNDTNLDCREYYIVHVTDGEADCGEDGCAPIDEDGVPVAKRLRYMQYVGDESGAPYLLEKALKVVAVGIGIGVSGAGTDARGQINCQSFWGGVDANLDGDGNPLTMDDDVDSNTAGITLQLQPTTFPGTETDADTDTSSNTYCSSYASFNDSSDIQTWYGNGYIASNAAQLASALQSVVSSISEGSFSGGEPIITFSGATATAGTYIYGSSYDVDSGRREYYGHLRKFRSKDGEYVDCDNVNNQSNPIRPCWDAGGVAVVSTGSLFTRNEYADTPPDSLSMAPGLSERRWTTRRVFTFEPSQTTSSFMNPDESQDANRIPNPTGTGRTIANMVSVVNALTFPPAVGTIVTSLTDLAAADEARASGWMNLSAVQSAVGGYVDTVVTYAVDHVAFNTDIPAATKVSIVNEWLFAAGKPQATFSDGTTKRCGTCSADTANSPKFGYPNHSKPIIVGPPIASTTDSGYTTFKNSTLAATSVGGSEDVVERANAYGGGGGLTAANPCGEGWAGFDSNADGDYVDAGETTACLVKFRRKVVYIGGNDGAVHAFDERSGHELWAFIPPGMLRKLALARAGGQAALVDGNAIVRDIKMPSITNTRFADGLFHTVLIYSVGMGGRMYFALDVTNPVDPKFMWESHNNEWGYTVARPEVGELGGSGTASEPKAMVFVTSGIIPSSEPLRLRLSSLRAYDGALMSETNIPLDDLGNAETAVDVINALTGAPRAVDANLDGLTDRVYFGDIEGRMWKACNLQTGGGVTQQLFFDPGAYDRTGSPGQADGGGNGSDSTPLGSLSGDAADRQTLRGPIYHPADVTHVDATKILVAFGSGNIQDPLVNPTAYKSFVWVVADNKVGSGSDTCLKPTVSACAGNTGRNTYTGPNGTVFDNVNLVNAQLTGAPIILAGNLVYPEFERLPSTSCTSPSYVSRIVARDVFDCSDPAAPPFTAPNGTPTDTLTYNNSLITGISVDTATGLLVVGCSTCATPPLEQAPGLMSVPRVLGMKQVY